MTVGVALGDPSLLVLDLVLGLALDRQLAACALAWAFVGDTFEARWLPSTLFCQPPPGCGPVTTAGFFGIAISLRRQRPHSVVQYRIGRPRADFPLAKSTSAVVWRDAP